MTSQQSDQYVKILCEVLGEVLSGNTSAMAHNTEPGVRMIPVREGDLNKAEAVLKHIIAVGTKPDPALKRTAYFNILRGRSIIRFKDVEDGLKVFAAVAESTDWQLCLERLSDDSGSACHIMASPALPGDADMTDADKRVVYHYCSGYYNRMCDVENGNP